VEFPKSCKTIFFPGCTLSGTRPFRTLQTYNFIKASNPNIGIVLDCCTKTSHDLGRQEFFNSKFGEMKKHHSENGIKEVIVACPNCYKIFMEYGENISVRIVYEVLIENSLPLIKSTDKTIMIHDP